MECLKVIETLLAEAERGNSRAGGNASAYHMDTADRVSNVNEQCFVV